MKVFPHFAAAFAAFSLHFRTECNRAGTGPASGFRRTSGREDASISPSGANIPILLTHGEPGNCSSSIEHEAISRRRSAAPRCRQLGRRRRSCRHRPDRRSQGFTTNMAEFNVARLIPVTYKGEIETVFGSSRDLVDAIWGSYGTLRRQSVDNLARSSWEGRRCCQHQHDLEARPPLPLWRRPRRTNPHACRAAREGISRDWC